jgi:hypothetical protein
MSTVAMRISATNLLSEHLLCHLDDKLLPKLLDKVRVEQDEPTLSMEHFLQEHLLNKIYLSMVYRWLDWLSFSNMIIGRSVTMSTVTNYQKRRVTVRLSSSNVVLGHSNVLPPKDRLTTSPTHLNPRIESVLSLPVQMHDYLKNM